MSRRWSAAAAALILGATLALARLGEPAEHAAEGWQGLPAFDFLYGLAGCLVIVLFSKALGRLGLQRPEAWNAPEEEEDAP